MVSIKTCRKARRLSVPMTSSGLFFQTTWNHSSNCTSVLKSWLERCWALNTFELLIGCCNGWQFLLFWLTIFLFDSQEHHQGADDKHASYNASSDHVHLLLQREGTMRESMETISFHFTQPAQSSLFLAFSPSLIHHCLKRLKNWSSSFQHATRPLWSQTARGGLSFYPTPGCIYLFFSVLPISTLIIYCLWLFALFSTSAQGRALPCTQLQTQA